MRRISMSLFILHNFQTPSYFIEKSEMFDISIGRITHNFKVFYLLKHLIFALICFPEHILSNDFSMLGLYRLLTINICGVFFCADEKVEHA